MDKFYLYPGSVFINKKPHLIDTVLGSCIAVALVDPVLQYGSINHYMLPEWSGSGVASNKYGNIAIKHLIDKMVALGSKKSNLKAKVFGGSIINNTNGVFNIGSRNADLAFEFLKRENIPVISQSVGGPLSRKVIFFSDTGDVLVKFIQPVKLTNSTLVKLKPLTK